MNAVGNKRLLLSDFVPKDFTGRAIPKSYGEPEAKRFPLAATAGPQVWYPAHRNTAHLSTYPYKL
jgi:hypothetical protein